MPRRSTIVLIVLLGIGASVFLYGASSDNSVVVWGSLLVNFLFWTGLAQGMVIVAALMQITKGEWAGPIRRLAEAGVAFLPVSFLLFGVIFLGRETLFIWIHEPVEGKQAWLNVPFLFSRDAIALLLLYAASFVFVRHSRTREQEASRRTLAWVTPALLILYAFVMSLIALDLAMSLDPHWYSNIFGLYYFVGNIYVALAALAIASVVLRKRLGVERSITPKRLHDLGKLLFGFCLFWAGMLWAHFLPIWYGNLPEETGFVIERIQEAPWAAWSWTVLVLGFILPFTALLSRAVKRNPRALAAISAVTVLGLLLERYILVMPSLLDAHWESGVYVLEHRGQLVATAYHWGSGIAIPFGLVELMITTGAFGAVALSYLYFLNRFPPSAD